MLRPHDREDTQLGQVRRATHRVKDALILFRGKAVFGDDFGRDLGHARGLSGPRCIRLAPMRPEPLTDPWRPTGQ